MPDENGYSLIRRIRRLPQAVNQIPAIALTAFGRSQDRIQALEAGFQMHVPKPVEPTELMMVIASLTGRSPKLTEE
jgi:CheY-like chemotaxis protein